VAKEHQDDTTTRNRTDQQATTFAAGLYGAQSTVANANATDAMRQGMDQFREAASKLANVDPKIAQGNLFEYIEAAKFNADAALKGSSLKASVTAAEGDPHSAADILVRDRDKVVREVQAKSYGPGRTALLTHDVSDEKYSGMLRDVPVDQADSVRDLSGKMADKGNIASERYADVEQNVSGELAVGDVTSGGTTYQESLDAAQNPSAFAWRAELGYVLKEANAAGQEAALAAMIVGGAISVVRNGIAASKSEISVGEATAEIGKDVAKVSIRSYAIGAGGAVIRHGAAKAGLRALTEKAPATLVAAAVIDVGVTVYAFAKGELDAEQALERVGQTGTSAIGGLYAGLVAGAVFGPAGALVGGMIGYFVASSVYQSSLAILKSARLVEMEAERVISLCSEACRIMDEQRQTFEREFNHMLEERRAEFCKCFSAIDYAMRSQNPEQATMVLAELAAIFGHSLKYGHFEDFDNFMVESNSPLII
jgi:hypothetical protein